MGGDIILKASSESVNRMTDKTMAKRKKINIATDECESHHVCRRVLFFSFLCCRYEGEGQGMKQTFEC